MCKALNALSPTPGTSARVGRDERDEGWELARLTHAPARVLSRARDTRKLESQTPNLCTLAHRGGGIETEKRNWQKNQNTRTVKDAANHK